MKSIEIAMGHAMDQLGQQEAITSKMGGKIGAAIKAGMTAGVIALAMAGGAAHAEDGIFSAGSVIGAVAGGLLGNQVGGGDGKTIATAAGAVIGSRIGSNVENNIERQRQQQAMAAQGYGGYGQGGYPPPVVAGPGGSAYAPACFAQWHGQAQPTQPLSAQGRLAMDKMSAVMQRQYRNLEVVSGQYTQVYGEWQQAQQARNNPQTAIIMGDQEVQRRIYTTEYQLNQAARARSDAEATYGGNIVKALDACEWSAARGEDVTAYKDMEKLMTMPIDGNWTMRHPVTGVTLKVNAGGPAPRPRARGM